MQCAIANNSSAQCPVPAKPKWQLSIGWKGMYWYMDSLETGQKKLKSYLVYVAVEYTMAKEAVSLR